MRDNDRFKTAHYIFLRQKLTDMEHDSRLDIIEKWKKNGNVLPGFNKFDIYEACESDVTILLELFKEDIENAEVDDEVQESFKEYGRLGHIYIREISFKRFYNGLKTMIDNKVTIDDIETWVYKARKHLERY